MKKIIIGNQRNYALVITVFSFFLVYAIILVASTKSIITLIQILLYGTALILLITRSSYSIIISKITIGLTMIVGGTLLVGGSLLVVLGILMQGENGAVAELLSINMFYGIFNLGLGIIAWRKLENIECDSDSSIRDLKN